MQKILLFFLSLACLSAMSAETELMDLSRINTKHNLPGNWYRSSFPAFQPAPKISYSRIDGRNIMHISEVKGEEGCRFDCYRKHRVLKGDRLVLTADVRGRGAVNFAVQAYSGNKWMGFIGIKKHAVGKDWQKVSLTFNIDDLAPAFPTSSVICLFGTEKNSDIQLRGLTLRKIAEIAGSSDFPHLWTAFLPMDLNYRPTAAELKEIPEKLNGVSSKTIQFIGSEHHFREDFGGKRGPLEHGAGNCAWLYGVINAEEEEDYTLGAGADWWMQIHVNGIPVIDTLKNGNDQYPPRITDHKATVRLKKGRNVLAVKYMTGAGCSILALGGPDELRNVGQKIRITEELWSDHFEDKNLKRSGNPRIIPGEYSFALVGPSRQGKYSAAPRLDFAPARSSCTMPKIASGKYFGMSFRLISLKGSNARLDYLFKNRNGCCRLTVSGKDGGKDLNIKVLEKDKPLADFNYPKDLLPMDLLFTANAVGRFRIAVESLANSTVRYISGESSFFSELDQKPFHIAGALEARDGGTAELTMDDWIYGYAQPDIARKTVPMEINVEESFDPRKKGWKLIFQDEFNGTALDEKIWYQENVPGAVRVRNGFAELQPVRIPQKDGKAIYKGSSFHTRKFFTYGYFETRVRFRQHDGWTLACWLYGGQTGNSYLDGMEIDIFEDYYFTPERPLLDFNFHGFVGRIMKSWNYVANVEGPADGFYTIGCKWTPLEITYYINGKAIKGTANHSPHKTVTYDALNHKNGFAPLRLCFHGRPNKKFGRSHLPVKDVGEFPDVYKIDYVRIWEYPEDDAPSVRLSRKDTDMFVGRGEKFDLEALVAPNARTKAAIKGVYLFDSGCLLDYKTRPPYKFTVSIDEKYYSGSNYMQPGRSREKPNLFNVLHAYSLYVQDAAGKVANSEVVLKMTRPEKKSTPYQGRPQVIPGTVNPSYYDEGGNGTGYLDDNVNVNGKGGFRPDEGVDTTGDGIGFVLTGEWLNLTVDIKEAGKYKVVMDYGAPSGYNGSILMYLNDRDYLGTLQCPTSGGHGWGGMKTAPVSVNLPAGRHVLKLITVGAFNFSNLHFSKE